MEKSGLLCHHPSYCVIFYSLRVETGHLSFHCVFSSDGNLSCFVSVCVEASRSADDSWVVAELVTALKTVCR